MYPEPQASYKLIVSFSGIDGAGKTTQIRNLCNRLQEAGLRVRVVRFWEDIARLTRVRESTGYALFKGDKGAGSPEAPIHRRDKNVRSWFMTCVRLCLYLVDALANRAAVQEASQSATDVIVFDRFIYDELANLNLRNLFMRAYARLIIGLVPKPNISYLLDADPIHARARKPEYPVEFLYLNRRSYLTLSTLIDGMTTVASMPLQQVEREVVQRIIKAILAERVHAGTGGPANSATTDRLARLEGTGARSAAALLP